MLKTSVKFMAVIMAILFAWGVWVYGSINHDEQKAMIAKGTEIAQEAHNESIERMIEEIGEKLEIKEYSINGTDEKTDTYPWQMASTVYVYYTADQFKATGDGMDIITVTTYYGSETVYSTHADSHYAANEKKRSPFFHAALPF